MNEAMEKPPVALFTARFRGEVLTALSIQVFWVERTFSPFQVDRISRRVSFRGSYSSQKTTAGREKWPGRS